MSLPPFQRCPLIPNYVPLQQCTTHFTYALTKRQHVYGTFACETQKPSSMIRMSQVEEPEIVDKPSKPVLLKDKHNLSGNRYC